MVTSWARPVVAIIAQPPPWPRYGGWAWAESPSTATRPVDHECRSTHSNSSHRETSPSLDTIEVAYGTFPVLQAVGTALVPFAGQHVLWFAALLLGFGFNGCFAIWETVPADEARIAPEHVGTAVGLILTIGGVGGFVVPWAVGLVVPGHGYTAAWTMVAVGTVACLVAVVIPGRRAAGATPEVAPAPQ